MRALLRRLLGGVPELPPDSNTVQIPDEVVSALRAAPGASLRIYFAVVPRSETNVVWWLDESTGEVKQ